MIHRSSLVFLALVAFAVTPSLAQGLKERSTLSDRADRSMKESATRQSATKIAPCLCAPVGAGSPIGCGVCVGGKMCTENNAPLRKPCTGTQ
jgi:hypothetical protein